MIKRFIACFTICFIITGLISPVFSDASPLPQPNWSDPGISEIINVSDLTGWMLNGGVYDVSTYTDSESFMTDYFNSRTSKWSNGVELYYYNKFGLGQDLYDIGSESYHSLLDTNRLMASSFREHSGYGRRFSEQANKTLLDSGNLYNMKIPLLNEIEFANFVGYNHDALRLYSDFFDSTDTDQPSSNLPDEYSSYSVIGTPIIAGINVTTNTYSSDGKVSGIMSPNQNLSLCGIYGSNLNTTIFSDLNYTILDPGCYVDINSENNNYRVNMHCTISGNYYLDLNGTPRNSFNNCRLKNDFIFPAWGASFTNSFNNTSSTFPSLTAALDFVNSQFRNISVYVNNDLWIIGGHNHSITPTINPEFPDAVGGEDLPSTTWPVHRPRAPYYTSVPGMLKAIDDAIQGDGKLDIDDLKPYLTDENGDPIPDPIFDPEPVPIPVPDPVNPDVVPGLPEIPAIPLDMPGYNGVSVLAEIINFTNQSLPTSLIITFWGIVFGIVILGLIKILHK